MTIKDQLALRNDLKNGMLHKDAAKKYGISKSTVSYYCIKYNLCKPIVRVDEKILKEIVYKQSIGVTYTRIAKDIGVTKSRLKLIRKKYNL